ncbi:chloride channel protein [Pseudomonadales bacterium]|nr:chloride channel protein [Pseudomonadales bacterium]
MESEDQRTTSSVQEVALQFFLAVILGLVASVVANAFVEGARWFEGYQAADGMFSTTIAGMDVSFKIFITMGCAALLIILVRRVLGITAWSGPAESIYAVQQSKEPLDIRVGVGSTLAAFISASGGASVGQYGPLVHFGATISQILLKLTKINIDKNVFLACGVAAAISAGFNAPIAGVLFAHEALLRRFSVGAIAPIAISSIVAYAANQYLFTIDLAFTVPDMPIPLGPLIPFLLIAAPLCSLGAIAYMSALRKGKSMAVASGWSFAQLSAMCVLVAGCIGMIFPDVLGLGSLQINQMINNEFTPAYLLALLVAKIIITALCINAGFFGGVFGPALFVGAAIGGIVAYSASIFGLPPEMTTAIGVASMAAVSAAVIGAPLTVIMIVIELTGSYSYGLASMLCVIVCSFITYRAFGLSHFDRQLLDRGIDLKLGREHIALNQSTIGEIPSSDYVKVDLNTSAQATLAKLKAAQTTEAYVCDDQDMLLGKVNVLDLHGIETLTDIVDTTPLSFQGHDSLTHAMEKTREFVGESIPVVEEGRLVAALTEGDLFNKVLAVQEALRKQ